MSEDAEYARGQQYDISDYHILADQTHLDRPNRTPLPPIRRKKVPSPVQYTAVPVAEDEEDDPSPLSASSRVEEVHEAQQVDQEDETDDQPEEYEPHEKSSEEKNEGLKPGQIGKLGSEFIIEILLCAFAVLSTAPFVWLAISMSNFHHQLVTDSRTNFIKQATSTISTVFTILFAAVMGSTLKRFANWRLERGVRLGLLEQLMQSRTFFAAIVGPFTFKKYNIASFALVIVWVWSPLGSQAALRLISNGQLSTSSNDTISYLDTLHTQIFDGASVVSALIPAMNPTYVSSLLGSDLLKSGTVDFRGNVRIPWLQSNLTTDQNGWASLTEMNLTADSYSSLLGIPVVSLRNVNSSFVIETTYMKLDCDKPGKHTPITINTNVTAANGTFFGPNTTTADSSLLPWQLAINQHVSSKVLRYSSGYPEMLVNDSDADLPQASLLFQSQYTWVAKCKVNQIYVESNVSCVAATSTLSLPICAVQAQRTSKQKHSPSTLTWCSFPFVFLSLVQWWVWATNEKTSSYFSSMTEYYLQNTTTSFILGANGQSYADYSNVTAAEFTTRFGQLLNTWVLATQISALELATSLAPLQNSTVTYTQHASVFVMSRGWLIVYSISIVVMFAAACLGIYCASVTVVPDILTYCSSLTRDSIYFDTVRGGSSLDGMKRAEVLKDLKVRLGEPVDERGADDQPTVNAEKVGRYLAIAPFEQIGRARTGVEYT